MGRRLEFSLFFDECHLFDFLNLTFLTIDSDEDKTNWSRKADGIMVTVSTRLSASLIIDGGIKLKV